MVVFAWILLLASSTRVQLVDEVYQIPAKEWRFVELGLNQKPAKVSATYRVESGPGTVRLALMPREDLGRLQDGVPESVLDVTRAGVVGFLGPRVRGPGEYVIVVDNRGEAPARVHLRINLDFRAVTQLSRQRQVVVVAISFAVFFGIVGWSARRLWREIKH
jgi:hypothetical protein